MINNILLSFTSGSTTPCTQPSIVSPQALKLAFILKTAIALPWSVILLTDWILDNNQCNSAWISVLIYIVLLKPPLCCANALLFSLAIFQQWSLPYCTPGKHATKCPVTLAKLLILHVTCPSHIITHIKELLFVISVRCHIHMHWV